MGEREWIATTWTRADKCNSLNGGPQIIRMTSFSYDGVRFAVRHRGRCLNVSGKWEFEPQPSSRTDAFFRRCRFTSFSEALDAANKSMTMASVIDQVLDTLSGVETGELYPASQQILDGLKARFKGEVAPPCTVREL